MKKFLLNTNKALCSSSKWVSLLQSNPGQAEVTQWGRYISQILKIIFNFFVWSVRWPARTPEHNVLVVFKYSSMSHKDNLSPDNL